MIIMRMMLMLMLMMMMMMLMLMMVMLIMKMILMLMMLLMTMMMRMMMLLMTIMMMMMLMMMTTIIGKLNLQASKSRKFRQPLPTRGAPKSSDNAVRRSRMLRSLSSHARYAKHESKQKHLKTSAAVLQRHTPNALSSPRALHANK